MAPWLYARASYECATRLPRPDEVFGDGVLVLANLNIETGPVRSRAERLLRCGSKKNQRQR
jgi:hypothetical protein